jgi:hypothetical protein
MDATRRRRTRDGARRAWYARHRQRRFARCLGFADVGDDLRWARQGAGHGHSPIARAGWAGLAGTLGAALASSVR